MDSRNSQARNSSRLSDEILVDKKITYHLQKIEAWDAEIFSQPFEHRRLKPLYVKGSGLYGEFIHSGMVVLANKHFIAFEREFQKDINIPMFKGFRVVLIPIEECYHITRKIQ